MVLVAVEGHLVFLGPSGITVFLAKLVGLGFPAFRGLAFLDLLVFIKGFAELPDGLGIRNLVAALQPKKTLEAQTVGHLILHLVV